VRLGGAGRAAAAVAARAPAEQDDDVAGLGVSRTDVFLRGRAHHRADLHALGDIAGVVELVHLAGGQADLVAVGAE
jgi:hypothetical protein